MSAIPVGINNTQMETQDGEPSRVVDTCCRMCVFAEGKIDEKRFLQDHMGCSMGSLVKMKELDETIIEAEDEKGNQFHTIEGRVCPFYRTEQWLGKTTIQQGVTKARKEATFKYDVVLYFEEGMKPESVIATINGLSVCNIKPEKVYISNNSTYKPSHMVNVLKHSPLPWRLETAMEKNCDIMRAVDIAAKKCTSMFLVHFVAGYVPQKDFFDKIDSQLYDKLDKFIAIEPISYSPGAEITGVDFINGMVVMRIFHRQVAGSTRSFIIEKTRKICEAQKCPRLLRKSKEMIPQW